MFGLVSVRKRSATFANDTDFRKEKLTFASFAAVFAYIESLRKWIREDWETFPSASGTNYSSLIRDWKILCWRPSVNDKHWSGDQCYRAFQGRPHNFSTLFLTGPPAGCYANIANIANIAKIATVLLGIDCLRTWMRAGWETSIIKQCSHCSQSSQSSQSF